MGCFAPLAGIFFGLVFGWFLSVHFTDRPITFEDSAVRFLTAILGVHFWAMGIALVQQRELHCGGSNSVAEENRRGLMFLIIWQTVLVTGAVVTLLTEYPFVFLLLLLISSFVYFGEIGWGDPYRFVYLPNRWSE